MSMRCEKTWRQRLQRTHSGVLAVVLMLFILLFSACSIAFMALLRNI